MTTRPRPGTRCGDMARTYRGRAPLLADGPPDRPGRGTTLIDEYGRAGGEKRPSDRSRSGRIPEPQALSTGHLTPPVSSRRDHPSDSPSATPETILARWH